MVTQNRANEKTAASGKILQGQGVGTASDYSTATYPSTATGTGTILRADGTNWTPTTATFPNAAGTSGNILISDGTNWVSSTRGQVLFVQSDTFSPADGVTYAILNGDVPVSSVDGRYRMQICNSRTITACYGSLTVAGTLGSTQNATIAIRLNNTSNTNVTTTLQFNNASATFSNTGLNISVVAGDYINFILISPTWTTNPTQCSFSITALLV